MRFIFLSGCLHLMAVTSLIAAPQAYEVSKVGDDKQELVEVFEAVKKATAPTAFRPKKSYYVQRKLDETTFIAGLKNKDGVIGTTIHLEFATPRPLADGQLIKFGPDHYDLHETHTLTGTQTELPMIREIAKKDLPAAQLTQKEFIVNLRFGKTYKIKLPENCSPCKGWGRVYIPTVRNKDIDGKVQCKTCKGKGKIQREHLVKW